MSGLGPSKLTEICRELFWLMHSSQLFNQSNLGGPISCGIIKKLSSFGLCFVECIRQAYSLLRWSVLDSLKGHWSAWSGKGVSKLFLQVGLKGEQDTSTLFI